MLGITRGTKNGEIRSGPRSPRSAKASISSEISLKPPIPVPSSQPILVRSSASRSRPDCSIAILAAATPTWLKRAMRFASLKSMNFLASKFLSSATVFTGRSETSKVVAMPRPDRPSIRLSQYSARLLPFGARTPMPVTTTRCSGRSPFRAMLSCYGLPFSATVRFWCDRRAACKSGRERGDDLAIDRVLRDADGAANRAGIGAAMGDDRDAVHANEQPTAQLPPVDAPAQRLELGTEQHATDRGDGIALDRIPDRTKEQLGRPFSGLDEDIAGKSVANDHVGLALEEIVALDIADEVDPGLCPQQWFGRLYQLIALP